MSPYAIIIVHFFSDWILQPRHVAENKTSNPLWMLTHIAIIFGCFMFAAMTLWPTLNSTTASYITYACVLNCLWHFFIDSVIWKLFACWVFEKEMADSEFVTHNKFFKDKVFYITVAIDQMLHLGILFYLFGGNYGVN